jgi:hypothetical protein
MNLPGAVDEQLSAIGDFKLDENGLCQIQQGHDVEFTVESHPSSDVVLLHGPIMRASTNAREALFARALAANLLFVDDGGLRVGYEANLDNIVLVDTLSAGDLEKATLAQRMEAFVDRLRSLREALADSGRAVSTPLASEADAILFRG